MDEDEAAQRDAEHKAAALYNVGWDVGAGATIWARAVRDLRTLHDSARERLAARADLEAWERLHGTALMLAVAIAQVLAFERRVRRLTGDAELARARARFDAISPDAEQLRDLVAHLDDYAVGQGQRQTGRRKPALSDEHPQTFIWWLDRGGTLFSLGDRRMDLHAAAAAATDLAAVVEQVRTRHLAHAQKEADAAARRRYGLPPE